MLRPTDPVKRVCYADDLAVWASGVKIPDLEVSLNNYIEEVTVYLKDNYLLISCPKVVQIPKDIEGLSRPLLIIVVVVYPLP